jgi:pantoate--beta-alanine ligase
VRVVTSSAEAALRTDRWRAAGLSTGFVPTMGALHEGHAKLFRVARAECDRVSASIFVNPTQFSPGEDLAKYPTTPEKDLETCSRSGVDLVFIAEASDIYPERFQTWVTVEALTKPLCGRSRPGHFRGVTTVVAALLSIVRPHRAYFGLKDYQQARVIERMASDLHLGTEIRAVETVREPDGLALSSRNAYLDAAARSVAPRIYRALSAARDAVIGGEMRVSEIEGILARELRPGPDLEIEYADVRSAATLEEFSGGIARRSPDGILLAVAARVGGTRLIDNVVLPPES